MHQPQTNTQQVTMHQGDHPTKGDHKGPYYATKRLARPVHRRGDGLSSPWGGVVVALSGEFPRV